VVQVVKVFEFVDGEFEAVGLKRLEIGGEGSEVGSKGSGIAVHNEAFAAVAYEYGPVGVSGYNRDRARMRVLNKLKMKIYMLTS
jgi:hypothetical protein